mmetsp:Transcript_60141/g.105325  ORF Transcript_60141/g.105325 Transcript_60141/m.105325 type:complete len:353 (-) Transcript_60141:195-1253(-)
MWSPRWNLAGQVADRLAYAAPEASYTIDSYPGELILVPPCEGDKQVPCLFVQSSHARFIFICFHGNAEDLGKSYDFWKAMCEIFQVHILAVEYPGYGICEGPCSEAGIMANATAAMQFVTGTLRWPLDSIKLFGRSLGTGPSIALAARYDVAGLVLVTPFLSIREIFRSQVGKLADIFEDSFLNYKIAEQIQSQTLIIHGKQDKLIPCSHGMQIYSMLQGKKMMVCPDKMHHNTALLEDMHMFVRPMMQFFSLPDYTFVDPELPDLVLPKYLIEANKVQLSTPRKERPDSHWPGCKLNYRSTSCHPDLSFNVSFKEDRAARVPFGFEAGRGFDLDQEQSSPKEGDIDTAIPT